MEIKTYIGNNQNRNGCVPRSRATNALSSNGASAQLMIAKYSMHVTKQNTKSSIAHVSLHSNLLFFILKKIHLMLGLYQSPILFLHELVSQIPISGNCENRINAYVKPRRTESLVGNRSRNKTVREETWFLKFIGKLESWELNLRIWNFWG